MVAGLLGSRLDSAWRGRLDTQPGITRDGVQVRSGELVTACHAVEVVGSQIRTVGFKRTKRSSTARASVGSATSLHLHPTGAVRS